MARAALAVRKTKDEAGRPTERALARLWQNAHWLSDGILTQDGRRLRVVYPGRLSGRAGPDFRDSVIVTESGETLTGDVELHLQAPDWISHRHHIDPNYNGVVLHVVLHPQGRESSDQQSGGKAPVASLGPVADLLGRAEDTSEGRRSRLDDLRKTGLGELLDRIGDERFLAKSKGFALEIDASDPEEALYAAILEGLGYSSNRKPFRELASIVPFCRLASLAQEPGATRLLAIWATLVNASGLMDLVEPPDAARGLRAMLTYLPRTPRMAIGRWHLFRVRPSNHPVRRIAGAARLLDRYVESGLLNGVEEAVRRLEARALVERLMVPPLVGRGRAGEIVGNAVLPFVHAWAGLRREARLRARCLDLYHGLPMPPDNEITREMRRLLSPWVD